MLITFMFSIFHRASNTITAENELHINFYCNWAALNWAMEIRSLLTSLCAFFVHNTIAAFSASDRITWSHFIFVVTLWRIQNTKKKKKQINFHLFFTDSSRIYCTVKHCISTCGFIVQTNAPNCKSCKRMRENKTN